MKKKLKVNINRPVVSSEEIAKNRNFEHVLKGYKAFIKPFYLTKPFLGILTAIVIGGLGMVLYYPYSVQKMYTQHVLTTKMLQVQEYTIDPHKDTLLITLKGAKISIPADAIQSNHTKPVVLTIKEAYSMEDIALAGLSTKSGKELLSSGGMIYIQAKDSVNVHLSKAVTVSVPTAEVNYNMNVYKGVTSANGAIDWQNPKPLKNKTDQKVSRGEELFKSNCKSCHKIGADAVGSDLAYIGRRREKKWLYSFIKNNAVFRAGGDTYAICVYEKYNKSEMTAFVMFSNQDIDAIADYCNKEADRLKLPYPDDQLYICAKKCEKYHELMALLTKQKETIRNRRAGYIQDNGAFVKEQELKALSSNVRQNPQKSVINMIQQPSLISGMNKQSEYYEIEITTFGWHNIDILAKNLPGVVPSTLIVNIDKSYQQMFSLYLTVPDLKLNVAGGALKGTDDQYGFYEDNGRINLPQKTYAFVYLIGEKDGKLLYASASFQTSANNRVALSPEVISKETFNQKIKALLKDETIAVKAKESKHAEQIKNTDFDLKKIEMKIKDAEKLKPIECDCDCGRIKYEDL